MSLILALDCMAERYGVLPSEAISRGNTFDLYIMDAAMSYHNYRQKKASGQFAEQYSTDELQAMMQKAKEMNDGE